MWWVLVVVVSRVTDDQSVTFIISFRSIDSSSQHCYYNTPAPPVFNDFSTECLYSYLNRLASDAAACDPKKKREGLGKEEGRSLLHQQAQQRLHAADQL
jgi:hypothetical protein